MEVVLKPIDMVDLVDYSISVNKGYANKFNVSLDFQKTLEAIKVEGDWDRLIQVMTNLISNAIKFSPPEKPVEISLQKEGDDKVRVTVSDQGQGIPKNFRSRIFQKFSQADSSDTRSQGGTGLGLSICKAIIESHHGTIDYNTKDNQGTEFFFVLPIAS